jgi:hypothetical protein
MGTAILTDQRKSGQDMRRSSRLQWRLPLHVYGQDTSGEKFIEVTEVIDFNLHGCAYCSRHCCRAGSYVTLRVLRQGSSGKDKVIRGRVKQVQVPINSRELYRVGVEMDIPGNVWGVSLLPRDWRQFLAARFPAEQTSTAIPSQSTALRPELPVDPLSPDAVSSINTSPASIRLAQAAYQDTEPMSLELLATRTHSQGDWNANPVSPSENCGEEELQGVAASRLESTMLGSRAPLEGETMARTSLGDNVAMETAMRGEPLAPSGGKTAELDPSMAEHLEGYRSQMEEVIRKMEQLAAAARQDLAASKDLAEKIMEIIEQKVEEQLSRSVERVAATIDQAASRSMDRHLVRLSENAYSVTREVTSQLEAGSATSRAELQAAVRWAVENFRQRSELHAGLIAAETTQKVTSALAALEAEYRALCDRRRESMEGEIKQIATKAAQNLHQTLKAHFYSWLVEAVGAPETSEATAIRNRNGGDGGSAL